MALAEEMVEFPRGDGSLFRVCEWCWAVKHTRVLGERHSLSTSTDKQTLHLTCSWAWWVKLYSRDQPRRRTQPHSDCVMMPGCLSFSSGTAAAVAI